MAIRKINSRSLGDTGVATADIADGSITTAKLAADAVTTAKIANTVNLGRRNLIINGAMQVAQRGTSGTGSGYQSVDRMRWSASGIDELVITQSQSTDAPDDFDYSYKFTVDTAESSFITSEFHSFRYIIEGRDCKRLAFGTSSAKKTTLSFWIKSSVIGDYAVLFYNDNGVDPTRSQTLTYTINTANTWEYKTITFDEDTVQAIHTGANAGVDLYFILAAGPDRLTTDGSSWGTYTSGKLGWGHTATMGSAVNDTWQITAIQFEIGDTATPFEHRSYGEELALCQRYYYQLVQGSYMIVGMNDSTSTCETSFGLPVEMRVDPTLGTSGTPSEYTIRQNGSNITCDGGPTILNGGGKQIVGIRFQKSGALNTSYASYCFGNTSGADLKLDAEL